MKRAIELTLLGLIVAALLAFGAWIGHRAGEPTVENIAPAAAQSLPSGAVELARSPAASAPKPKKAGTKVLRSMRATIQPDQSGCAPITTDIELVQDGDGLRAIASAEGGRVVAGLDSPVVPLALRVEDSRRWAAGLSCSIGDQCDVRTAGIVLQRDIGRVTLGIEALRRPDGKPEARAIALWRW